MSMTYERPEMGCLSWLTAVHEGHRMRTKDMECTTTMTTKNPSMFTTNRDIL